MSNYTELSRIMERTIHKYIQIEKKPRLYGPGILLTQAEIHTIAIVGDMPDINVTKLAALRGITKGAASQMIYKLVDKGFVEKRVSPNSDTEVCITLTESGKIAYEEHKKFHAESGSAFFKCLKDMPDEYENYLIRILEEFEKALDERLDK